MPIKIEELKKMLQSSMPEAKIHIEDLKGDGDHYSVTIKSKEFRDKTKIQQHQMVYKALDGKMGNELHAMMLKTIME